MTDEFKIKYKRPISNMYNCKKCCYLGVCSDAQVTHYLQIRKKTLSLFAGHVQNISF